MNDFVVDDRIDEVYEKNQAMDEIFMLCTSSGDLPNDEFDAYGYAWDDDMGLFRSMLP